MVSLLFELPLCRRKDNLTSRLAKRDGRQVFRAGADSSCVQTEAISSLVSQERQGVFAKQHPSAPDWTMRRVTSRAHVLRASLLRRTGDQTEQIKVGCRMRPSFVSWFYGFKGCQQRFVVRPSSMSDSGHARLQRNPHWMLRHCNQLRVIKAAVQ